MKRIITLIAIATMALGFAAVSMAQDAGPQGGQLQGKMRRPGQLKMMQKFEQDVLAGLNLNDDQKKQIADLNTKTMQDLKDLRDKAKAATGDQKHNGVQVRKVMQDRLDTMKTILTPEQWKTYREQMMQKMKEYRQQQKALQQGVATGGAGK
jgi:Spy/CpxP family protein refolding chaperone